MGGLQPNLNVRAIASYGDGQFAQRRASTDPASSGAPPGFLPRTQSWPLIPPVGVAARRTPSLFKTVRETLAREDLSLLGRLDFPLGDGPREPEEGFSAGAINLAR